jgi:hypothetical protein
MEDFKKRESDFPTYYVCNKNFVTTPQPKLGHYLKALPTGQFKDGYQKFEWQNKLKPGWVADIQFAERNYDLNDPAQAEYFENIPKTLQQPQLLVTIRDWRPGSTEYSSESSYGNQKRVSGYFVGSLVSTPKIEF